MGQGGSLPNYSIKAGFSCRLDLICGPKADVLQQKPSLDHLVGGHEKRWRHVEAESLRGLEVQH
jgi:hypothetical protein